MQLNKFSRWIEFVALFIGVPVILRYLPEWLARYGYFVVIPIIPVLIIMTFVVYGFLRCTGAMTPRDLIKINATPRDWLMMLVRFAFFGTALSVFMYIKYPQHFLEFPRYDIFRWGLVMMLYLVLSVYPQGIIYRMFYSCRYASLFRPELRLAAGAFVFSFAHLAFANPVAIGFTFIGGLFFLSSYNKTKSLLFSGIEHALYGNLMFTVGLGHFFFHAATLRMLNA